jgi:hypothetical protein
MRHILCDGAKGLGFTGLRVWGFRAQSFRDFGFRILGLRVLGFGFPIVGGSCHRLRVFPLHHVAYEGTTNK